MYRGWGQELVSRLGHKFGPCAVKAPTAEVNAADRLKFLIGESHTICQQCELLSTGEVPTFPFLSAEEELPPLAEASVMKQFNTAYIVKLLGVVSDSKPPYVVMEMMEKGNLRDYLRNRRPLNVRRQTSFYILFVRFRW